MYPLFIENSVTADEVTQRALAFLRKNKSRKFFLWLHYFDPHGPYTPPPSYRERYLHDSLQKTNIRLPISYDEDAFWMERNVIPDYIKDGDISDVDYYVACYDGEIRFVDDQIGILSDAVRELGLDKRTLIVLTSDHGEGMGEHGVYFAHGLYLYEEFIRVPLLFRYTGRVPARTVIEPPASHIDLMPTIFGFLKIKTAVHTEGIDLTPFLLGKDSSPLDRPIFSVHPGNEKGPHNIIAVSLRDNKWKLICKVAKKSYQLYDLEADPLEQKDLAESEKEQLETMKSKLQGWLKEQKPYTPPVMQPLDEDTRRKLESLGYL